jgi:hypothetical protein
MRIRLSSKPCKAIVLLLACQLIVPTGFPPVLHSEELNPSGLQSAFRFKRARLQSCRPSQNSIGFSRWELCLRATERFFRSQGPMQNRQQAAAEEDSFKKRSLGGSCDNAKTLRGTLSPNAGLVERPIPGIEPVHYLMPDERQEIRIKRPASHTTLDGLSFIPRVRRRRKGLFTKLIPGNPGLPTSSGRAI